MKLKFLIKSTVFPATLYIRVSAGRGMDFTAKTSIAVSEKWNPESQDCKGELSVNSQIASLRATALSKYNEADGNIDSTWLKNAVCGITPKRKIPLPSEYIAYSRFWLKEKAPKWKIGHGKTLSEDSISQNEGFLSILAGFRKNIPFEDIDNSLIDDFAFYLSKNGYSKKTTERHIGRFRFFCHRAISDNISIDGSFADPIFVKGKEVKEVYLDMDEIRKVYDLDFTNDDFMDAVRDNFILSCLSGLRVSDFLYKLGPENLREDRIVITTTKTGQDVVIPLHPFVRQILKKRHGALPMKVSSKTYNLKIKIICQLAELDERVNGSLYDEKTGKKTFGNYPKYQLVSSHSARRSMATNLKGKVSDETIAAIMGWRSTAMLKTYDKTTVEDHAKRVENLWQSEY